MLERLQTIQRPSGTDEGVIQSTKLIVDHEYARIAADFVRSAKSEIRLCAYACLLYTSPSPRD